MTGIKTPIYCFDTDSESSYMAYDFSQYDDGGWYIYHAGFRIHPITNDIYTLVYPVEYQSKIPNAQNFEERK